MVLLQLKRAQLAYVPYRGYSGCSGADGFSALGGAIYTSQQVLYMPNL